MISAPEPAITEVDDPAREPSVTARPPAELVDTPDEPDGDDDEDIEELDSLDLEAADDDDDSANEHTQIGAPLDPDAFSGQADLADRLEAHLADAEAEADADLAAALQQPTAFAPPPILDDGSGYGEEPAYAEPQAAYAEPQPAYDPAGDEFAEEVSDFDVVAEADADDADLLAAHGEAEAEAAAPVAPAYLDEPEPEPEPLAPPTEDFAARLALDDEDGGPDPDEFDERHASYSFHRRPASVAGPEYDPPSGGYTVAEGYPNDAVEFDEPHAFSVPDSVPARDSDDELESALSALDVDLDDLSAHGTRPLPGLPVHRGRTGKPTPQPTVRGVHASSRQPGKPRRATEDDGVLIDFDDDDE